MIKARQIFFAAATFDIDSMLRLFIHAVIRNSDLEGNPSAVTEESQCILCTAPRDGEALFVIAVAAS